MVRGELELELELELERRGLVVLWLRKGSTLPIYIIINQTDERVCLKENYVCDP